MLVTFVLVGIVNVRYDFDTIRIIREPNHILTAVIGNSHSSPLRYPDSLHAFYLTEPGALLPQKIGQVKSAISLFSNLQLAIVDISPAEFYACGERGESYIRNYRVLDTYDVSQLVLNTSAISNLIVVDPRKYLSSPPSAFNLKNGKAYVRDAVADDHGAARSLERCRNSQDLSMMESEVSLDNLVSLFEETGLFAIFVAPPHTKQFRTEFAENLRGSTAVVKMYSTMHSLQSEIRNICFVNLYELELDSKYFWDGDHLNRVGEEHVAPILENQVTKCLSNFEDYPIPQKGIEERF